MPDVSATMLEFPSNGGTTPGYLARPPEGGPYPGLVIIQEWWGLVDHIKDVAGRFAREGFVTLAPDLYHGQTADEPDEARKLAMALDRDRAVAEILAAARYMVGLPDIYPHRVGVVGWCLGGGLALSSAAESDDIGAVVAFYGRPLDPADTARLRVPVLGLYAERDHGIPPEAVRAFQAELDRHGIPHEIHIYPGAQHAFFNDTRPQAYHPQAASDAWIRTIEWLVRHLVRAF